jgi:hypothetical protein
MTTTRQLAAWYASRQHLLPIRPLTTDELAYHDGARVTYCEAQSRFKLFRILELNYKAWDDFRQQLLQGGERDGTDPILKFDHLMLNLLTSAYAITEHFAASLKRRFRGEAARLDEYRAMVERLCAESWAFAFFSDFRNYVQHCGLPIGQYRLSETPDQVTISVTQNSAELCHVYKQWRKSKLDPGMGSLDLITLTEEYYHRLRGTYGNYVATTFAPDLVGIDSFYGRLTDEVQARHPEARMVFAIDLSRSQGAGPRCQMTVEFVPNRALAEIGIGAVQTPG